MSAFVVSNATINAVCHLLDLDGCGCPRGSLGVLVQTATGPRDQGDVWGEQLQALNLAAVGRRYAHRNEEPYAPPFTWSPRRVDDSTYLELIKCGQCWAYQCNEGDEFSNTELYKRVTDAVVHLLNRVVSDLPAYKAIEWDLPENKFCVR